MLRSRGGTTDSCHSYLMEIRSLQNDLRVGDSSRLLREVELSIIRHEKCNQILKDKTGNIFTMAQEGVVCGYSQKGGDTCQVSSWASCHTAPLSSPQKSLIPRHQGLDYAPILHLLFLKLMDCQGKRPQFLGQPDRTVQEQTADAVCSGWGGVNKGSNNTDLVFSASSVGHSMHAG